MTLRPDDLPVDSPRTLERALIWYARRFPISRGKLRVIDTAWRLAAGADSKRTAELIVGNFKAPCDLRDMLQRQFYFFGTYYMERHLLDWWANLARRSNIIFDIGANGGIYSLAALAANCHAQVFAFEPTPEIAERLRWTAKINRLHSLHVHEVAVMDYSGEATLVRCRGDYGTNDGMNYIRNHQSHGHEQVTAVNLDTLCSAQGIEQIDLMKLDIQGAEPAALRGAERLLCEHRIKTMLFELNWGATEANCPATQSVAILEDCGYQFSEPRASPAWRPSGDWMRSLTDVVAAPAGRPGKESV